MNRTIILSVFVIAISFIFISCNHTKEYNVFYEKTFQEIEQLAKEKKKPFCIVLSTPDCSPCLTYLEYLDNQFSNLSEICLFNIVNVSLSQNSWYKQWLSVTGTPTTCVFDMEGDLLAVLPGSTIRCMQCVENVLNGEKHCAEYAQSVFKSDLEYGKIIELLGKMLRCYFDILEGKDIGDKIDNILSQQQTPFGLYLKLVNEETYGTKENCETLSYQLLSYSYKAVNINLYKEYFLHCKKIIDPNFKIENEPVLFVKENPIKLDNCIEHQDNPFEIIIKNDGKIDLEIYDILLPCTCLSFIGDKQFSLKAGEETKLSFTFVPDISGTITREIIIVSNGVENILTTKIIAEVS